MKKTPYTMTIESSLWSRFKSKCALENVSMLQKLTELITNYTESVK